MQNTPQCLGLLFSRTEVACMGDRRAGKSPCALAAQCASDCDRNLGVEAVEDAPSWSKLNASCVQITRSKAYPYGLSRV